MAGDWIKMRSNLHDHPKVIAMSAALGLPELHVVGCLWRVWAWADSHTIDGNAVCVTDVTLDRMTAVTGFADALRKVGWLEGRDSALSFPRFAEHNGQTAKNRSETAARVAKHRNAKTVTSVTEKPLPEKRREEKKKKDSSSAKKSQAFVCPTVPEVAAYCRERSNAVDPQAFCDFYAAKGWRVGNQAMKDWRACVRTWEKRDGGSVGNGRGTAAGGGSLFDREQHRQDQQQATIAGWLAGKSPTGGLCQGDGAPGGDEAHGAIDHRPA